MCSINYNLLSCEHWYLDSNQIKEIPESISQLVNLQKLYLDGNKIKEIPKSISQLVNLRLHY